MSRFPLPVALGAALALAPAVVWPLAAQSGLLFPDSFLVEHHLEQREGETSLFVGPSVTDHYGGSWIVSVRPDEGRMVVDLARRELTEIRPERGTYWSVSFDRLAELRERYLHTELGRDERRAAARTASPAGSRSSATAAALEEPEIEVVDVALESRAAGGPPTLSTRPGIRHLRASLVDDDEVLPVEVWVDPRLRLGVAARQALADFERTLESPDGAVAPSRMVAAARDFADGALPVRTRRLLDLGGAVTATLEDVTTRVEPTSRFPIELVRIPEGFRRIPHPLELLLAVLDNPAGREALVGNPVPGEPPPGERP